MFQVMISTPYQPLVEGLADMVLLATLTYVFSTYLMLEDAHQKGIVTGNAPTRFSVNFDKLIRMLLIFVLSLKLYLPVTATQLLLITCAISLLVLTSKIVLREERPVSLNVLGKDCSWVLTVDFFCLVGSLLALASIHANQYISSFFGCATLVIFVVLVLSCGGGAVFRFWIHKSVLRELVVDLFAESRVEEVTIEGDSS